MTWSDHVWEWVHNSVWPAWTAWKLCARQYGLCIFVFSVNPATLLPLRIQTRSQKKTCTWSSLKKSAVRDQNLDTDPIGVTTAVYCHHLHWTLWMHWNEKTHTSNTRKSDAVNHFSSVLHSSLHHINVICCDNKCNNKRKKMISFLNIFFHFSVSETLYNSSCGDFKMMYVCRLIRC